MHEAYLMHLPLQRTSDERKTLKWVWIWLNN